MTTQEERHEEIVELLLEGTESYTDGGIVGTPAGLLREAADLITTLTTRISELEKALEPFARAHDHISIKCRAWVTDDSLFNIEYQHLVRARSALGGTKSHDHKSDEADGRRNQNSQQSSDRGF